MTSPLASTSRGETPGPERTEAARKGAFRRFLEHHGGWIKLVSAVLIVAGLIVLVRQLPTRQAIQMLSGWVEGMGFWGPVVFGGIYVIAAVLFVPGAPLTLAGGAIFGLLWGTVTVSLASTTAAAIAFLIARYLARDSVRQWARRYPKFEAIDRAIGEGGWKIVALLRLSPAVPYSVSNYLYGLTAVRFVPYVLATWLAMLPGTFLYIYLGYAGRTGLAAAAEGGPGRGPWQWTLLAVGLAATLAVTIYITRLARRAIGERTRIDENAHDQSASSSSKPHATGTGPGTAHPTWGAALSAGAALITLVAAGLAYTNRDALGSLFGPPSVKMKEAYQARPGGAGFDHSPFTRLLQQHVRPGGWVDYQGLQHDRQRLQQYIDRLGRAPFDQLGRNEKLALLLNAYNAFTLELILEHYPRIDSIKDIPPAKRWKGQRWKVGSHTWSLDEIEQEQIRPKFREPRVHFALVCAAIGCPPLRREAYTADRLDAQLADQARYVHNHPRWFRDEPAKNVVHLTRIYKWYGGDFEQAAGSVLQFVARYAPRVRQAMTHDTPPRIEWLNYDWSLNSVAHAPQGGE